MWQNHICVCVMKKLRVLWGNEAKVLIKLAFEEEVGTEPSPSTPLYLHSVQLPQTHRKCYVLPHAHHAHVRPHNVSHFTIILESVLVESRKNAEQSNIF